MDLPPGPAEASRGLQGPPGASRGLQGLQEHGNEKCARRVPPKPRTWARLKFHAGWSGWTRPPTMAGGGSARVRRTAIIIIVTIR